MDDVEEFLAQTVGRHASATTAVRSGDATLFVEMLSTQDPLTLFPASQPSRSGWSEVTEAVRRVASIYSGSSPVTVEVVAAGVGGDLAYLVGYERGTSSVDGGADTATVLRITHVYQREDGEWRLVHRHADPGPGRNAGVDLLRASMRGVAGGDG